MSSPPRKHLSLNTSPQKQIRSPLNSSPNKNKNFWQSVFKKETEKAQKRVMQSTNEQTLDDDEDLDDYEQKHPYIEACFDRVTSLAQSDYVQDFINKVSLLKLGNKFPNNIFKESNQQKEKNVITDLPDTQKYQMYNGVQFQLKKIYGQYQIPIQKSIHFISNSKDTLSGSFILLIATIIFFVGNYIAVHNLILDETKYIGIDQSLQEITCLEVQTVDTIIKGDFSFNAPTTTQQNNSPSKQQVDSSPQLNTPQHQNHLTQSNKELMTLLAIAERAKESYIKEQKFSSKKVYGISNSQRKKLQKNKDGTSPTNNLGQLSPSKSKLLGSPQQNNMNEEQHFLRYIVKVNVFNLNNPSKRYVLQHIFDEYFYVQQIYLRDKESFCYTLCTNQYGEQLFFIWNFRKETIMAYTELKAKINKFNVSPHKNELVLFLGHNYLKYHEANFTNKMMKENSLNIVPMKIEKESNFVDLEYLPKSDIFIIITDSNHAFLFEKNALKFKIMDKLEELGKETDSVVSDTLEIGDLSDKEQISKEEEHLIIPNVGTNIKSIEKPRQTTQIQKKTQNQFVYDQDDDEEFGQNKNGDENPVEVIQEGFNIDSSIKFEKVLVTQRGFMIGASNGYFFLYEFQKEEQPPKLMFQVHLSNKIKSFVSMSLSRGIPKNEEYLVALTGVYQKQNRFNNAQNQNFEGGNNQKLSVKQSISQLSPGMNRGEDFSDFFMPRILDNPKKKNTFNAFQSPSKHNSNALASQLILDSSNNDEEKIEYQIVNLRSIQTQQLNKIVQKIFTKGNHDGSIYQIAQCKHKSWLYTLSEGSNLKIWSHTNEWNGVANYYFEEQPICLDVHPSSWQIALGFKSGVKIYQSLDKCLKLQFEKLGKAALALQYSDGGQYLACANAVYVEIIDPMRMQLICTLFGHKGLIRTINWTPNSKFLISTCNNGGIFFWRGNFKQQTKGQKEDITPLACLNDKNYLYQQIAFDEDLETIIALTNTSTIRVFLSESIDCVHEENLLTLNSCYGQTESVEQSYINLSHNLKVTNMNFSKHLGIIAIGYSNGKIGILNWPICPNKKSFKYEIALQQAAVTDLLFTYNNKYLVVTTDDGNIYVLETFRVIDGNEKQWSYEYQDSQNIRKRREQNGLRGYSITDNFIMCNKQQLEKVNKKIDKLELQIKTHEVNYKIKVSKKLKKFEKQKKLIDKDLQESLEKQDKLIEALEQEFQNEKDRLYGIKQQQSSNNNEEKQILVDNKEQNLSFVANENDELENKILRLKEAIVSELEIIEDEHSNAVVELINSYEQSIKTAQEKVKNTIDKLKSNGVYYESMIALQEKDYEGEINKLQTDLIDEHYQFKQKKNHLEKEDNRLKEEYQEIEENFKEKNHEKKSKMEEVKRLNAENKNQETNLERLQEKQVQSNIFIDEKERSIWNTYQEKKQLENVIVFLSTKIKELKDERKPLEEKKRKMEVIIEETYRELQDDFQFRKYMELQEESLIKKMSIIDKEIVLKEELKKEIEEKFRVFKRELSYLKDAKSMKGWIVKVQGMLNCMKEVQSSIDPEQMKKISMEFIHIAEIMESNARPQRANMEEEDVLLKQSKMNEMDLAYHRNKSSQKLIEMKFRYKQLFKQLEKQIFKLRNDNVKLIEEFNTLQSEHKKLNNLRLMIKESIKELLGDEFNQEMVNSSDDETYKKGGNNKKLQSNAAGMMNRSKSTSQITSVGRPQENRAGSQLRTMTARDLYQVLPDLKQTKTLGGSQTQRDLKVDDKKQMAGGFIMKKKGVDFSEKRLMNTLKSKSITHNTVGKLGDNRKYLNKIVEEFEKNRKQIEDQTNQMQNIQKQMNHLLNAQPLDLSQSQSIPVSSGGGYKYKPTQNQTTGYQQIPQLNLVQVTSSQQQHDGKSLNTNGKQTITTRIPNTSDRTTISILDQGLGGQSYLNRQNKPQ